MFIPQIHNENEAETPSTYQQPSWEMYEPEAAFAIPPQPPQEPQPQLQQPPLPPVNTKRGGSALRTATVALLILLLAGIFSVGLFAGWQFSRTSSVAGSNSSAQTSTVSATATVETAQEAAIAKIKAAVTEIDVTTQSGSALGSGVIIDKRGYIVTNNHVVSGAQSITVVLSDGSAFRRNWWGRMPPMIWRLSKSQPRRN